MNIWILIFIKLIIYMTKMTFNKMKFNSYWQLFVWKIN